MNYSRYLVMKDNELPTNISLKEKYILNSYFVKSLFKIFL